MKAKNIVLLVIACIVILVPLAMVFSHLNFSFHRRSWEKSRLEGQRNAAHGFFGKSVALYGYALADAQQFPISPLMLATTLSEAGDSAANDKEFALAQKYYDQSQALIKKDGRDDDQDWLALKFACLSGLGKVLYAQGQSQNAEATLTAALPVYNALLKANKRTADDLVAGDSLIHDSILLASIYSILAEDSKATAFVVDAQKLQLKFPVDTTSRELLTRLAQKYKVAPAEEAETGGI